MLRFPLVTRYSDYDTKGHVNNAVYLTYFEWARVQAWMSHVVRMSGLTGPDVADPPLIVAEARVKYVSPANIGVPLEIEIAVKEIRTKGFSFGYRILDARDDRLIAEGETVQVAYDYAAGRTMALPPAMRKALEAM
ncbi:MAG: acyl-CoA thioesterase [Gemmatimonadaceae bacterium]|nr:acyl-CoA thioesterase [Gemmatimonadaceae bacterium]